MVRHTSHLGTLVPGLVVGGQPLGRAPLIHQHLPTVHLIRTPSRGHLSQTKEKFQRYAYESNQGNQYKALIIGNYLHVLVLTQILGAALLLLPPDVTRGVVVSNTLHPSLVPQVLKQALAKGFENHSRVRLVFLKTLLEGLQSNKTTPIISTITRYC